MKGVAAGSLVAMALLASSAPAAERAEPPARNGPIVFASDRSPILAPQLFTVEVAGGRRRQLTRGPRSHSGGRWSPDGRRIAFREDNGLAVAEADGTNVRTLVPEWFADLVWSPDGDRIAYTTGSGFVEIVSAEGGAPVRIGRGERAAWSPDGSAIVAASAIDGLVLYDLVTGETRVLAKGAPSYARPTWSPSGQAVAYAAFTGEGYTVHIVPAAGGAPRVVTDGWAAYWSPDGTRLAVVRDLNLPAPIDLIDLRGRTIERLTESGGGDRVAWSRSGAVAFVVWTFPTRGVGRHALVVVDGGRRRTVVGPTLVGLGELDWAPDGRRILVGMQSSKDFDLYRRDPDTGRVRRLTASALDDSLPASSPDGRELAFVRGGDGLGSVYVLGADGRSRRLTRPVRAYDTSPSWSPDGAEIAFERRGNGVYVVPAAGGAARPLVPGGSEPTWSPSRPVLAFVRGARIDAETGLAVVGTNGRRPRLLVGARRAARALDAEDAFVASPSWSPDGELIAFVVWYARGLEQELAAVLVVRPNGTGLRVLAREAHVLHLAWSPDSRTLLLGGSDVVRMSRRGVLGGPVAADVLARDKDPAWLPVCTVIGSRRSDAIRGTPRGELVCGLGGADRIVGGRGHDRLFGHGGNDTISSADGGFDVVGCGAGRDVVVADPSDRVGIDCERVTRG